MTERQPSSPEDYARNDLAGLVGYLLHLGMGLEDAKDIACETVKRMCESWPAIKNPKAWARTTAYRIAVDQARARRSDEDKNWRAGLQQPSWTAATDDLWMVKEEHRIVIERVRQLPLMQRTVIALHLDGFSNIEIAGIIDSRTSTVASNLRHAKRRLAAILANEGVYRLRGTEGGGANDSV